MNRRFRLARSTDFKRVRRLGKSYAHPLAVLVVSPSGLPGSRFGVAAGRSVGSAARRNRAKRRLREALRPLLSTIPSGWDVVLIARPALVEADWPDVQRALEGLLARAQLLQDHDRRSGSPSLPRAFPA